MKLTKTEELTIMCLLREQQQIIESANKRVEEFNAAIRELIDTFKGDAEGEFAIEQKEDGLYLVEKGES